jgi:hypothetical protein
MLRQVDWAWVALGAVETHRERPVDARLATNRVARIAPSGSVAERERAAAAGRRIAAKLPAPPVLVRGS